MRTLSLLVSIVVLMAPTAGTGAEIGVSVSARERVRLPVVIVAPRGAVSSTSRSGLLHALTGAAKAYTDLIPADLPGANECVDDIDREDRFRCIGMLPVQDGRAGELVLVISVFPKGESDRVSAVLLDAKQTRAIADAGRGSTPAEVEMRIRKQAILARVEPVAVTDEIDVERFSKHLFERRLRSALERTKHWSPYGAIDIHADVGGFEIELDGIPIGAVSGVPTTHITEVRAGSRTIALRHEAYLPARKTIVVTRDAVTTWVPDLTLRPDKWTTFNSVVFWTGAAAATAGTVVATLGIVQEPSRDWVCWGGACELRSAPRPLATASEGNRVGDSGISFVSLSFGLIAAGVGAVVMNLLLDDDDRLPWPELLVGVGAGAAGFTTAFLVGRSASNANDAVAP